MFWKEQREGKSRDSKIGLFDAYKNLEYISVTLDSSTGSTNLWRRKRTDGGQVAKDRETKEADAHSDPSRSKHQDPAQAVYSARL